MRPVPTRLKPTIILTVASILLVGGMCAWLIAKTGGFSAPKPESPLKILLATPESNPSYPSSFVVRGCTSIPSAVRLKVNGTVYSQTWTGANNQFAFDEVVLPSRYSLAAEAVGTEGSRRYSNYAYPTTASASTNEPGSAPDPLLSHPCELAMPGTPSSGPQSAPAPVTRKVNAMVSYQRLRLEIWVELPKDDPRAVALVVRNLSLDEFIRRVFLDFRINGSTIDGRFQNVNPEITTSASVITIHAWSNEKKSSFDLAPGNLLFVMPSWGSENARDTLSLQVADYDVRSITPTPASMERDKMTWTGETKTRPIMVGLNYDLLGSPARMIRIPALSPFAVLPFSASWIAITILALLVGVPMIWFLFIVDDVRQDSWLTPQLGQKLNLCGRFLLAVVFSSAAIYTMSNQSLRVRSCLFSLFGLRFNGDDDFRNLIITAILLWSLAAVLALLVKLIGRRPLGFWLQMIFGSIRDGLTLTLIVLIIVGFALLVIPRDAAGVPDLISRYFAIGLILLLSWVIIDLYRTKDSIHGRMLSGWKSLVIALGVILLALIFSAPRSPFSFYMLVKRHNTTLDLIRTFLFQIRDLAPYVLFPVIALVLRRVEEIAGPSHPLIFRLATLLFAAYVVGSSTNIFLVPIPFFLALIVFPRYVIESPAKYSQFASARTDVLGDREAKLKSVLDRSRLTRLRESWDQLEQNHLAGVVTDKDFQKRKDALDSEIKGLEAPLKLQDDLPLESVVVSIGPQGTNWQNGLWAARRGLAIALPFSLLYLWQLWQIAPTPRPPYFWLSLASPLLTFLAYWTVCAFFFGYFFPYIRGKSGLRKGLIVSTGAILCLAFVWAFSLSSFSALFLRIGETLLFFTLLGVWSDYLIFHRTLGKGFKWKEFTQFEHIPTLAAFTSVFLASFSTAATSVMRNQFEFVLKQLVEMVATQLYIPPLPPIS